MDDTAHGDMSDKDLLARHVDGDKDAFGEIVRRHRDRLWAVALRTLGDREEAADAVQDALVSAYRAAHTFRGQSAVTTWLHRITVNACLDRARKAASRKTSPIDDTERLDQLMEPGESAAAPVERGDLHRELVEALGTLPYDQRAALVLVDMQGYPVAEAARVLDVPSGTVKSRCARGRAKTSAAPPSPAYGEPCAGGRGRRRQREQEARRGKEPDSGDIRPTGSRTTRCRTKRFSCREGRRWTSVTATTDSAGHPEVTEISELTEGLLSPSRTSAVRRHLDGCELCADVYASLEEIRGILGTLPGPPSMPADVAGRIDAALAAEALLDSTAPDDRGTVDTDTDTDEPAAGSSPSAPASATAPPSSASASASAVHVSRETSPPSGPGPSADRPAGRPRAATGPGRGKHPRRPRRRTAVLGAVFTAAAIGLGSLLIQAVGDDGGGTSTTAGRHDPADSFSEEGLKGQVADLLAKNSVKESQREKPEGEKPSFGPRSSPESPEDTTMGATTAQVPECIQRGIGERTPLAAEEGSYEGKRAYLVVVPHDSDTAQVSAYVVDAACVGKSSPPAGKVLLTHSYPQG
ncbi:hypothetical protein SALBM135S_04330 [Streptomyces alboniger]